MATPVYYLSILLTPAQLGRTPQKVAGPTSGELVPFVLKTQAPVYAPGAYMTLPTMTLKSKDNWPFADRYSAARPSLLKRKALEDFNSSAKQTSKWFELPGEIRNRIYDYVTEKIEFDIRWLSRHSRMLTHAELDPEKSSVSFRVRMDVPKKKLEACYRKPPVDTWTIHRRKDLSMKRHINCRVNYPLNVNGYCAWLLTCRQIHDEGGQYVYQKATFTFRSRALLHTFVHNMTPELSPYVRNLNIFHSYPGEPQLTEFLRYKWRDDASWVYLVKKMTSTFTGLKRVEMVLQMNDGLRYFYKSTRADWAKPIRRFASLDLDVFKLFLTWGETSVTSTTSTDLYNVGEQLRRKVLKEKYIDSDITAKCKVLRIVDI